MGNKCYKTIVNGELLVKLNTYFFGNIKLYKSDGYIEFSDGTQQTTAFVKSDILEMINVEVVNRINDVDQETFDRITAVEQEAITRQNAVTDIQSRINILATTIARLENTLGNHDTYIHTLYEGFLGAYPDTIV